MIPRLKHRVILMVEFSVLFLCVCKYFNRIKSLWRWTVDYFFFFIINTMSTLWHRSFSVCENSKLHSCVPKLWMKKQKHISQLKQQQKINNTSFVRFSFYLKINSVLPEGFSCFFSMSRRSNVLACGHNIQIHIIHIQTYTHTLSLSLKSKMQNSFSLGF